MLIWYDFIPGSIDGPSVKYLIIYLIQQQQQKEIVMVAYIWWSIG